MNVTIPMLLVSTLATVFARPSMAQDPGQPRASSRRPVDVSVEGLATALRRGTDESTRAASNALTARTSGFDCVDSLADQADPGGCLMASSSPTLGLLYPYPGLDSTFVPPAFVGGGEGNWAIDRWSTIGGGLDNTAARRFCTVGGGRDNRAQSGGSTVGGGSKNEARGYYDTVGGGQFNRATYGGCTIAGGEFNSASGTHATVGGGAFNSASGYNATVAGGFGNTASGESATVGGGGLYYGFSNTASGDYSTVGGGRGNEASGDHSTVGGGRFNEASEISASIGGGAFNVASGFNATVAGGFRNTASGNRGTVPGGLKNVAAGTFSFAAGRFANADHTGAFVWGDSQAPNGGDTIKPSSAADEFNIYASGGVRLFTNSAATTGVLLAPGGSTWTMVSDRDAKENVEPVNARAVLEKVAELPVATWNYEAQDDSIRHMGPMAQDFHAAFGLGLGDKTIDTIDPNGVALAAIQGLNDLVEEKDAEIDALRAELASLRNELSGRMRRLEEAVGTARSEGEAGSVPTLPRR